MSIRLSKVGNISEALPYTSGSSFDFGTRPYAYITSDAKVYPFFGGSLMGKQFRAYKDGILGDSGSTLSFAGGGTRAFRENSGDYFLAGFELTSLFDIERDSSALVGINSQCNVVTLGTDKLPQIFPMVIWTPPSSSAGLKPISTFCQLPPKFIARFTSGVTNSNVTIENEFEISPFVNGVRHEVYFGWFMGLPYPSITEDTKVGFPSYGVKDLTISVNAASLKGNRPVFDPVTV